METVKLGDSPCCSELKKKLQKSEKGRSALRQAIKVLEGTVDRLQDENNSLKRVLDDERERVKLELEVYARKSASQKELEKEISCLKEEIYALQKTNQSKCQNEDREEKLCHRIKELEGEVDMLKENLRQERHRGDLESQKAESDKKLMASEKRKADDAKKHANEEKIKADDEKKRADLERNRAEEQRCFADAAKNEVALERQKLVEERMKVEEANRRAASEKDRADKEKKRADLQMKEAQELRQSIEVEKKRSMDEKAHGNSTQKLLEEERQRRETLEKELLRASSAGRENKQCPHCNIKDTSHPLSGYKRKKSVKEKLLKEKLKLKAKQLQNIERAAKEERTQRDLRQLEVSLLKKDAVQFWNRINLLENLFSRDDDHRNDHLVKNAPSKGIYDREIDTFSYQSNESFRQTIVSLLEEGDKLGNRKPSSQAVLVAYDDSKFSPCARCPFAKDVVCTENVLMMLLEQIQDQSVHACMHELVTMFKDGIESRTFFSKYLGKQSECMPACSSTTLFDKFSLLELLAFYMGWDWTYNKIIPPLLELLESSIPIVSVAAILILVGHLARLGIDASGHEEKGVEQLRCNLSQFLNPINKCCFLIQLATVTALLNILSIEFTKCIGKDAPSNVCKSNHIMIVRKWFNDLNTDQQSSSLCMLATDAIGNSG